MCSNRPRCGTESTEVREWRTRRGHGHLPIGSLWRGRPGVGAGVTQRCVSGRWELLRLRRLAGLPGCHWLVGSQKSATRESYIDRILVGLPRYSVHAHGKSNISSCMRAAGRFFCFAGPVAVPSWPAPPGVPEGGVAGADEGEYLHYYARGYGPRGRAPPACRPAQAS